MKNTLPIYAVSLALALAIFLLANNAQAQPVGNAQWCNNFPIAGASTNNLQFGLPGMLFIGTEDFDYIGLQFAAVMGTNLTSLAVPETLTLPIYRCSDTAFTPESTPFAYITLNSTLATDAANINAVTWPANVVTYLDVHGARGIYIGPLISTNAANTATNYITLDWNLKAAKVQAIESTFR